ncbi:hypothetical protein DY000_02041727 [Brassica cretica]|uniref:FBD domain-containing protein n=1 Tax=Brassica cretica TaxID=69181 RepID=A0ABQ7BIT2_BRACR|nr:hypothetical protein DY000_02041727 [Brassica cretica]
MRVATVTLLVSCTGKKETLCLLQKQLPVEKVYQIVHEAVEIETEFVCKALPCDFNWNELKPYEPVTLGCDRRYKAENPFDWMEFISLHETLPLKSGRQNFFDKRKGEYQKASVMSSLQDGYKNCEFKIDEDF